MRNWVYKVAELVFKKLLIITPGQKLQFFSLHKKGKITTGAVG